MNHNVRNGLLTITPVIAFPSVTGLMLSALVAVILYRLVPYLDAVERSRAHRISPIDLVAVLDGLTMCLAAGLTIPESMQFVGASKDSLAHRQLLNALEVYKIGQDLPTALSELQSSDSQWAVVSRILGGAHLTGAPVVATLDSLLEHLREEAQSEISTRIRALGVKSVLPLGLCFLPAFLLLTVVPLVAQFISQMHW
jgi:pilus assembly protein TadC